MHTIPTQLPATLNVERMFVNVNMTKVDNSHFICDL